MGFKRPLVRIQSLGPNKDNPNCIFQVGDAFGFFFFCMKRWVNTHNSRRGRILLIRAPPADVLIVIGVFGVLFSLPFFKDSPALLCFHITFGFPAEGFRPVLPSQILESQSRNHGLSCAPFSGPFSEYKIDAFFPFLKMENAAALQASAWCLMIIKRKRIKHIRSSSRAAYVLFVYFLLR